MRKLPVLFVLASAALAACTRTSSESAESASSTATTSNVVSASPSEAGTTGAPAAAGCPRTGKWALCSVEKRLEQSGFVVRRLNGEAPRRAGFSVAPAVYTLGRSRLEVFIYPSESALAADVAKIDTASAAPLGAPNRWDATPTFVRSGNLAAVFLTDNATQAERLTLALTAGAPQR
jgi:aminoglycoside phosphotransferase (APT) family kinase protein